MGKSPRRQLPAIEVDVILDPKLDLTSLRVLASFLANGETADLERIAATIGAPLKDVAKAFDRLEDAGYLEAS